MHKFSISRIIIFLVFYSILKNGRHEIRRISFILRNIIFILFETFVYITFYFVFNINNHFHLEIIFC
jgi:hypothetical protein